MPAAEIEEFAKVLIQQVRDAAIQSCDRRFRPGATSPMAERWQKASHDPPSEEFARTLIPDIVDDTIFYLLHAIDDGLLRVSYSASNGRVVDLAAEGISELAGWYAGSGGWRAAYAKERFVDDFSDLNP